MESAVGRSKINKRQDMRSDLDVSPSEAVTFVRFLPERAGNSTTSSSRPFA